MEELMKQLLSEYEEKRAGKYKEYENAWDYRKHSILSTSERPDKKRLVRSGYIDEAGRRVPATYRDVKTNRIAIPIEQTIVNTHTSFTVGNKPKLNAKPRNDKEQALLDKIEETERATKITFLNKKVVRSWLSEAMVAEYWWVEDKKLRVAVWSPFRGDILMPIKDSTGDLTAFVRMYKTKATDTYYKAYYIDDTHITELQEAKEGWSEIKQRKHGFRKIPVIYADRDEPFTAKVKHLRERLETNLSDYADVVDYNVSPKIVAEGAGMDIDLSVMSDGDNQITATEGGVKLYYLTWDQNTTATSEEIERSFDLIYTLTDTPRTTPKDLQGAGNAFSGVAFQYLFMGINLAVRNHEEEIGEYLTRRYNFLKHALTLIHTDLAGGEELEISPSIEPYALDFIEDKVTIASQLKKAGLASTKSCIGYVGLSDPEEELQAIQDEK